MAPGHILDNLADVLAVLDRGVTLGQVGQGDLVSDRDIIVDDQREVRIVFGDDAEHLGACLEAFDHGNLPFRHLVEKLNPERDRSRNPLFQILFAVQNTPMDPLELSGLTLSPLPADDARSPWAMLNTRERQLALAD